MKTIQNQYRINRKEINYLRITIESYDGMAMVRTLDPHEARIEIMISPGCEQMIDHLMASLVKDEGLNIQKVEPLNE